MSRRLNEAREGPTGSCSISQGVNKVLYEKILINEKVIKELDFHYLATLNEIMDLGKVQS